MLILFISIQGGSLLNHAGLYHHKQVEKNGSKKNIYLSFSTKDWQQVEKVNDDEIRIHGKMFDLKSIHFIQDSVIVYGHYDKKEDKILAHANELEKKKHEQKKQAAPDYNLFFEETNVVVPNSISFYVKKDYSLFKQCYYFEFINVESPPPQMLV